MKKIEFKVPFYKVNLTMVQIENEEDLQPVKDICEESFRALYKARGRSVE